MLLAGASVITDRDVVVHYSRPSWHASQALGKLASTSSSEKTLFNALTGMGQDFRYASARLIAAGELQEPRAKLLFLPASYCLSEAEAEGIAAFVREGGTVLADVMPGVLNEFGRRLPNGQLDAVFGATCGGTTQPERLEDLVVAGDLWGQSVSLGLGMGFCDAAVRLAGGTALETVEDVPILIRNDHGRGRAILLNFDIARAPKAMAAQLVQAVLAAAEVKPEYRLEGVTELREPRGGGGAQMTRNVISALRRGDVTLVGAVLPGEDVDEQVRISWDGSMHTYNVRTGDYLGKVDHVDLTPWPPTEYGERAQVHLLSLHAEPLRGITVTAADSVAPGDTLPVAIALDLGATDPKGRLLRIEVIDPAGANRVNLRRFLTLESATANAGIPFAFNDVLGRWTVRVTDLATGVHQDQTVELQ